MKGKKLFLTFLIFSFTFFQIYSQEDTVNTETETETEVSEPEIPETETTSVEEEIINIKGQEFTTADSFIDFIRSLDFLFDIGPAMYLNQHTYVDNLLVSSPSPSFDPVTIGILWPNYTFISMEPSLSYFSFYYLWYDGMALPAEIENRTAATLHFMLDLPVVIQLYLKNNRFQISIGAGILGRVGLLPGGVKNTDSGYSGTVETDMELINDWFWDKTRYLYLSTGFSWLYNAYHNVKIGPTVKAYFPIGGIINKEGLQGLIIDAGLKISL